MIIWTTAKRQDEKKEEAQSALVLACWKNRKNPENLMNPGLHNDASPFVEFTKKEHIVGGRYYDIHFHLIPSLAFFKKALLVLFCVIYGVINLIELGILCTTLQRSNGCSLMPRIPQASSCNPNSAERDSNLETWTRRNLFIGCTFRMKSYRFLMCPYCLEWQAVLESLWRTF